MLLLFIMLVGLHCFQARPLITFLDNDIDHEDANKFGTPDPDLHVSTLHYFCCRITLLNSHFIGSGKRTKTRDCENEKDGLEYDREIDGNQPPRVFGNLSVWIWNKEMPWSDYSFWKPMHSTSHFLKQAIEFDTR